LQKRANRKFEEYLLKNPSDEIARETIEDAYRVFGITDDQREDVEAQLQEEGDKVDFDAKEIKYTAHQHEFRNLC